MKAVKIIEPGIVRMTEIGIPEIFPEEVLLKINYVGLCGSDLSTYLGKNPMVKYPVIPGHEIAATIVKAGGDVPENFEAGQKVTVIPYTNCGKCAACRNGRPNACEFNQTLGVQRDGALCEHITVHWRKIICTDSLSDRELALTEPLTVGFHAVERAQVVENEYVMVLGCGMVGSGAIIGSEIKGAKVIAVDIDDRKLGIAEELGALYVINSMKSGVHNVLKEITGGQGPSVVIEAAGNPKTYIMAMEEVAFTGRVVCIGYAKDDIALATKLFVQKEMDIRGSRNATLSDFEAVIRYLESGKYPVKKLVTRIVTPEEVGDTMKYWSENIAGVLKILVSFKL
jgi:2-desacetyl-2-hydroxyethyl bacteriochlorophyllide A dehydrogenase